MSPMRRGYDEMGEIKKGPWKEEEDEVLINHVKRYGPRDWSSIRSKGLLQRTGKSCRLRWVNKLRPNLKSGVKFSAEEERVVIQLQGQFGNKWAQIATYLPGRTDNDVKNFWSSRQKRLARILQNPPPPPPPKAHRNPKSAPSHLHFVPTFEAAMFSSSSADGDAESSFKAQCCSSSNVENAAPPVFLPEFMDPLPELINFDHRNLELTPMEKTDSQLSTFPEIPPSLQTDHFPLQLFTRLDDPNFFSVFEQGNALENTMIETEGNIGGEIENNLGSPDSFIDDFPMDMFDHIEPLPSPSDW